MRETEARVLPMRPDSNGRRANVETPPGGFPPLRLDANSRGANVRFVLICEDEELGPQVAALAVRIGIEFRAARSLTAEHVAFALRNHAIVVLVPKDDAVASIHRIASSGMDGPILVLEPGMDAARRAQLMSEGAASCHRLPLTPRAFEKVLNTLSQRLCRRLHVPLWFDPATHQVGIDDMAVKLSPYEFSLLRCLVENGGEPVTPERLRLYAWGANVPEKSEHQIVTVLMCRLRKKLAQLGMTNAVIAVRGMGYAFRQIKADATA